MINIPLLHERIESFMQTNPPEEYFVKIHKDDRQRPYLGLSQIGHPCHRFLWYSFRHCFKPSFPSRMLRLFRRGDREEFVFVWMLRGIGFEIFEVDEKGKQFSVRDFENHVKGNLDGVAIVPTDFWLEGAEPHPVLTEYKTAAEKKFLKCVELGVEEWNPKYYGQLQTYCGYNNLKGALFFVVNKNDDSIYIEYVPAKKSKFRSLVQKAGDIVSANEPPERMFGASPSFWDFKKGVGCKYCDCVDICFRDKPSQKLCRTCRFASPGEAGSWNCSKDRDYGVVCELYQDIAK